MHINQLINNAKIARLPSCEACHARLSRECVFLAETETETETETERTRTTQSVSSGAEEPPPPAQWSVPLQALIKRRLLASHFPLGFWRWRGRCTGAGGVLVLGCRWLHSAEHPLRHMTPSNRCVCAQCVCSGACCLRTGLSAGQLWGLCVAALLPCCFWRVACNTPQRVASR